MLEIGKYNELTVISEVDFGFYLDAGRDENILLPRRYAPENLQINDDIWVFIYFDSEDRIIATTQTPKAQVGEFASLKVISVNDVGAFLDWGLDKDLLVPFREQKIKLVENQFITVWVYVDEVSERIAATSKLDKHFNKDTSKLTEGQDVELLFFSKTDLGYNAIINNEYRGLLFFNDIFEDIWLGQKKIGYVKELKEDGKIDLILTPAGYEKIDDLSQTILDQLKEKGGFIAAHAKTPPDDIYDIFGVSKKNFKKAIGSLYKKRLITIEKDGIKLVQK